MLSLEDEAPGPWSGMTFLRIVILLHLFDLSMICAQTRSADVARENRCPLFRITPSRPIWGLDGRLLLPGQFVICAVCSAWLNMAFSAAVISEGVFAV